MEPIKEWYLPGYGEGDRGPFTADEVLTQWQQGQIHPTTLCKHVGLGVWRPLREVEPFASACRKAARARRNKRYLALTAVALLIAAGTAVGLVIQRARGPAEVRQAAALLQQARYEEAGRLLAPYLAQHPRADKAFFLMGVAVIDEYAAERPTEVRTPDGNPLRDQQVQAAIDMFTNAVALRSDWRSAADGELRRALSLVPAAAPDVLNRKLAVVHVRNQLQLAAPAELAQILLQEARALPPERMAAEASDAFLRALFQWDERCAGDVLTILLAQGKSGDLQRIVERIERLAAHQPQGRSAMADAILAYAQRIAAGRDTRAAAAGWAIALRLQPDLAERVGTSMLAAVKTRAAAGEWETLEPLLEVLEIVSAIPKAELASVYLQFAQNARRSDPRRALAALDKALALQPALADDEAALELAIELHLEPDLQKLDACRTYLTGFPAGRRRPAVLAALVGDALAVQRRSSRQPQDLARRYLRAGSVAALEIMQRRVALPDGPEPLCDLARALAGSGDFSGALAIATNLLRYTPDAAQQNALPALIAEWRAALPDPQLEKLQSRLRQLAAAPFEAQRLNAIRQEAPALKDGRQRQFYQYVVALGCLATDRLKEGRELLHLLKQQAADDVLTWPEVDCPECVGRSYRETSCAACKRTGRCVHCGGRGYVYFRLSRDAAKCPKCNGSGRCTVCNGESVARAPCQACAGAGRILSQEKARALYLAELRRAAASE
jgi:hypothetical protein